MENFRFTAFEKTGEILADEIWTFENEEKAKEEGLKQIIEKGFSDKVYRLATSYGKLLLFQSSNL